MVSIMVRHKVQDYAGWRLVFEAALPMRQAAGELSAQVYRSGDDGNDVIVIAEWPNEKAARQFIFSEAIGANREEKGWWMQQGGVLDKPEIAVLRTIQKGDSAALAAAAGADNVHKQAS
jgi:quinol monooxygenase YgiN